MTTDALAGKWSQIMTDAQRRWTKLTEHDIAEAKGNVQEMVSLVQKRYGYSRERAEHDVNQFLDQYDRKVYDVARSLPGDVPPRIMRRPWATLATALGLGLAVGLAVKPGCSDAKRTKYLHENTTSDWTVA